MFTRIVVGVDGSRPADAAAQVAFDLASREGAHLYLVSVIEELPRYVSAREEIAREEGEATRYFQQVQQRLEAQAQRRGLPATTALIAGHEVQQLLHYAGEVGADLLAIGFAGHSCVWESALGSTAQQLLRRAPCSMLVVRAGAHAAESPARFTRVAVALDGSPLGWEAYADALALAGQTHHPLQVVSVVDSTPIRAEPMTTTGGEQTQSATVVSMEGDAWRTFLVHVQARAAARAAAAAIPIEVHMRTGPVSDALVSSAGELGADVLVLGATGHERPWAKGTGGTAMKVAEEAPCTVLVVRPPATGAVVADVMMQAPARVEPDTPAAEALTLLLDEAVRLLPVINPDGTLAGVITLGLVLRRTDAARLTTSTGQSPSAAGELGQRIKQAFAPRTARDLMNARPYAVRVDTPLTAAARYLTAHRITRVPVVNDVNHVVGLLGEREAIAGLLGLSGQQLRRATAAGETRSAPAPVGDGEPQEIPAGGTTRTSALLTSGELTDRRVPLLPESASLDEVLTEIEATPDGLALVVGAEGQLRGVIEARFLLQQVLRDEEDPAEGRWWRALARTSESMRKLLRGVSAVSPRTAGSLAQPATFVVWDDVPLGEVLARFTADHASSHLAIVVAPNGHAEGVLWRSHALRALVRG